MKYSELKRLLNRLSRENLDSTVTVEVVNPNDGVEYIPVDDLVYSGLDAPLDDFHLLLRITL